MRVVAEYNGEEIILKRYNSYLDFDRDLSQFHSLEELKAKLDLSDDDSIRILDNNNNPIYFNSDIIRKTLSYYENNKGDQFINWIIDSARENDIDRTKLIIFFSDRLFDFTKGKDDFSINDINNAEGRRLYKTIRNIRHVFDMYGDTKDCFEWYSKEIRQAIPDYVKKDGEYNYGYMRKFIVSLANIYEYTTKEPDVIPKEITEEEQEKVLEKYKTAIHNHIYPKKQMKIDDLPEIEEEKPKYDENGIKLDEKEFLEEFNAKKLHL